MKITEKSGMPVAAAFPIAFIVSALSALSLLVFHYLRNCGDAVSYYTAPAGKNLIQDALSTNDLWAYLLAAVLLGICHFLLLTKSRQGIRAGWLTSLPLAFNMIVSLSMEHSELREVFLPGNTALSRVFINAVVLIGFTAVLSAVITALYCLLDRAAARRIDLHMKIESQIRLFVIAYVLIFAGWVPALVMCFPGSLDTDALGQIKGYMGLIRIDAANPILPTLFYGWIFKLGRVFGKDDALSLFKIVILQDAVNAGFMALVSLRCFRYTKSRLAFLCAVVFFSLMPMWQRAAQHVLKDVFHTGWYLAFYVSFLFCLEKERMSALDAVILCFCCVMLGFTRNAAFFLAVIALIVLLAAKQKPDKLKAAVCLAVVASLYLGVTYVVYPRLEKRVKPPREEERYSLQLQQVALYCVEYGDELSDNEKRIINDTLNYNTIVQRYTPMLSDPVKSTWHGADKNHAEFWALYRKFLFRHPLTMAKSIVMSSFEHFNPWYSGNKDGVSIAKDPDFHQVDYKDFSSLLKMVDYWNGWLEHPVSRVFYGNGLYTWVLIAMLGYVIARRSMRAFLGLVPQTALMLGLCMSHANGLLRYGYPLIAATPLICAYTFCAVSKERAALAGAPAEGAQSRTAALKFGVRGVFGKMAQRLKNAIRSLCYSVLHLMEDKKK